MKPTHRSPLFVLCALSYVEIASVLRLWGREGNTTFGYYTEAMLFLGPWNGLFSPTGISSSSPLVPLLSIFLAPAVVALGIAWAAHTVHRKFGGGKAALLIGAIAIAHAVSGLLWGLANWGP